MTIKRTDKILCVVLLICVFLGNWIKLDNVKIMGAVVTLYRVGIPIITLYYVGKRIKEKKFFDYLKQPLHVVFLAIMLFWIVYGSVLIMFSSYVELRRGLQELLSLVLGMLLVYCVTEVCHNQECTTFFINTLKTFVIILCVMGIIECILGTHLPDTRYGQAMSVKRLPYIIYLALTEKKIYPATTTFFGANDFSTMLTIFFPLFFINKSTKRKKSSLLLIILIVYLVSLNDANICILAMGIVAIFWVLVQRISVSSTSVLLAIVIVEQWAKKWISDVFIFIKRFIYGLLPDNIGNEQVLNSIKDITTNAVDSTINMGDVLNAQLLSAENQSGSLYMRLMITIDALEMSKATYFLGAGPGSFTNYLKENGARSKIVNPHNWWLEILSQYGIIIFFLYVGILGYLFWGNFKNYLKSKDFMFLKYICVLIAYVISSISPSSFLGYSYQWIVPALGIIIIEQYSEK